MAEVVIKISRDLEKKVESWGVDLQPLFLAFLRHEFDKIKRFESAVKESKSEFDLKKLADEMDDLSSFKVKSERIFQVLEGKRRFIVSSAVYV